MLNKYNTMSTEKKYLVLEGLDDYRKKQISDALNIIIEDIHKQDIILSITEIDTLSDFLIETYDIKVDKNKDSNNMRSFLNKKYKHNNKFK